MRYYGWYSNRSRGEREKRKQITFAANHPEVPAEVEILDISDYRPKKIPSPQWRECIKKVWEIDPLECPKCGNEMCMDSEFPPKIFVVGMNEYDEPQFLTYGIANELGIPT